MAGGTRKLLVEIIGDAKSFLTATGQVEGGATKMGGHLKGLAIAAAGAFAAKEVVDWGKASVDKFTQVATETAKLQRITGGTAQEMSRLRFAGTQVGLTSDQLSAGFIKFSKAGLGPAAKDLAAMGISFRDSAGHAKPLEDSLKAVADKFHDMPGGAERTAMATKLFGRAGADLLPILAKGGDAIDAYGLKADRLGLTLGEDGVKQAKKYRMEQRDLTAAMDGLKVTVGGALMPVMTGLVGFMSTTAQPVFRSIGSIFKDHIVPAARMLWEKLEPVRDVIAGVAEKVRDFFKDNPQALFGAIAAVVGSVLVAAFWALASAVLAAMSPIILIGLAIAALVAGFIWAYNNLEWFRDGVDTVVHAVSATFGNLVGWVREHWESIKSIIVGVWNGIKQEIQGALQIVTGLFDFFRDLFTGHWSKLWDDVKQIFVGLWNFVVGWFRGLPSLILGAVGDLGGVLVGAGASLMHGLWNGIKSVASGALDIGRDIANGIIGFVNSGLIGSLNRGLDIVWRNIPFTSGNFPWHLPPIPKFHEGGIFNTGQREGLALLRQGEGVFTPEQMRAMGPGSGGGITVNVTAGVGDPQAIGAQVVEVLRQYERSNGTGWRAA